MLPPVVELAPPVPPLDLLSPLSESDVRDYVAAFSRLDVSCFGLRDDDDLHSIQVYFSLSQFGPVHFGSSLSLASVCLPAPWSGGSMAGQLLVLQGLEQQRHYRARGQIQLIRQLLMAHLIWTSSVLLAGRDLHWKDLGQNGSRSAVGQASYSSPVL